MSNFYGDFYCVLERDFHGVKNNQNITSFITCLYTLRVNAGQHWMPDSEIVLKRDFGIVVNLYKKNYTRGVEMLQFHPSLRLMLSNLFFSGRKHCTTHFSHS